MFAVINLENDCLIRDVNGEVFTWDTESKAWDWAMNHIYSFETVPYK